MDFNNFIFGLQASSRSMSETIRLIFQNSIFWGFAFGFIVATILHGFLLTSHPKHLPTILFKDKSTSFEKVNQKNKEGSYTMSFTSFSSNVDKVKFVFGLAFLLILLTILVALFRF